MLIIRCDWCGAETDDVSFAVEEFDGCSCCASPKAYAYGPREWYRRYDGTGAKDKWECPECAKKRFAARDAEIAAMYSRIGDEMKRANAKAQYGGDD